MGDVLQQHEGRHRPDLSKYYDEDGVSKFYIGKVIDPYGLRKIPRLILGSADDIKLGEEYHPCDYKRISKVSRPRDIQRGLENYVRLEKNGTPIYIIDDHNHALWAWVEALNMKILRPKAKLVHIDNHDDFGLYYPTDRVPKLSEGLDRIFDFVVQDVNIGDFINPSMAMGVVENGAWIRPEGRFAHYDEKRSGFPNHGLEWKGIEAILDPKNKGRRILDIDVDYFEPHLHGSDSQPRHRKKDVPWKELFECDFAKIRSFIPRADVVTISIPTSRSYMDPVEGIEMARKLLT